MVTFDLPRLEVKSIPPSPFFEEGSKHAFQALCGVWNQNNHHQPAPYVLKPTSTIGKPGCVCEIISNLLAQYFGLSVPQPAIVEISLTLVEEINRTNFDTRLNNALNPIERCHFGSSLISPYRMPIVTRNKLNQAAEVLAFDALIWNMDRTIHNPNILQYKGEFYLIDHEEAFAFKTTGMIPDEPWMFNRSNNSCFIPNHLFYADVKGEKSIDLKNFFHMLENLSDQTLVNMSREIPTPLFEENTVHLIKEHIAVMRENANLFKFNLLRELS